MLGLCKVAQLGQKVDMIGNVQSMFLGFKWRFFGLYTPHEHFGDEGLDWKGFWQGLDVTSSGLH